MVADTQFQTALRHNLVPRILVAVHSARCSYQAKPLLATILHLLGTECAVGLPEGSFMGSEVCPTRPARTSQPISILTLHPAPALRPMQTIPMHPYRQNSCIECGLFPMQWKQLLLAIIRSEEEFHESFTSLSPRSFGIPGPGCIGYRKGWGGAGMAVRVTERRGPCESLVSKQVSKYLPAF